MSTIHSNQLPRLRPKRPGCDVVVWRRTGQKENLQTD
jgi:hypothetical protein